MLGDHKRALFPPMTFFCLLTTDDVVEVIDVAVDDDFDWGLPEV